MSATVYVETIGCQMNVADSERADVRLRAAGLDLCNSPDTADVIIFNTCSLRERAPHKVFTTIGQGLRGLAMTSLAWGLCRAIGRPRLRHFVGFKKSRCHND